MVLLAERLSRSSKISSKLENQPHLPEAISASLQAFESEISKGLMQLSLHSKPRSEILTLSWIRQCLQLLPSINKAFAKLIVDIDHPMSRWEPDCVEECLKDSLKLMELLNSITSSLSHLGQARVSLSHALSLLQNSPFLAMERLEAIQLVGSKMNCGEEEKEGRGETGCVSDREWVTHQALTMMKTLGFWVCGVVVSSLCGDVQSCLEMRKVIGRFDNSLLMSLHESVCEEMMETGGVLKEISEVNNGVAQLVAGTDGPSSDMAEEFRGRLEMLGKLLEGVGEEVDLLFSKVLLGRNDLLHSLGQRKTE